MKEHATLFNVAMALAVMRDVEPKTQTRRLVTAQTSLVDGAGMSQRSWDAMGFDFSQAWMDAGPSPAGNAGPYLKVPAHREGRETVHRVSPRVEPGDALWGRESLIASRDELGSIVGYTYVADDAKVRRRPDLEPEASDGMAFAHLVRPGVVPSIHMPRWASRLVLPVSRVGVERLQDNSDADALAEGVYDGTACRCAVPLDFVRSCGRCGSRLVDAVDLFKSLWTRINGTGSWAINPHVWVYEFSRSNP